MTLTRCSLGGHRVQLVNNFEHRRGRKGEDGSGGGAWSLPSKFLQQTTEDEKADSPDRRGI